MEDLVSGGDNRGGADSGRTSGPALHGDPAPDIAVVGGGIVGLSTARALTERLPDARIVVLEKETGVARHQSGRNSGVIHSGVYYTPGSLKARFAVEGNRRTVEYCREHGLPHEVCGKVIVAAEEEEVAPLSDLRRRGKQNGLDLEWLDREALREVEPAVDGAAAVYVPTSGITDYSAVARTMAAQIRDRGVEIRLGTRVDDATAEAGGVSVQTPEGALHVGTLVNCAGLHSDRLARRMGVDPGVRIVPFRGEYFAFTPDRAGLVDHLVYPVPDPDLPFLGVHLTPSVDGGLHAGPNAVLALSREGYTWTDVEAGDVAETLGYRGFWKLAAQHWRTGVREMVRSGDRRRFARSLQRLTPGVDADDLVPAPAGVRAQAVSPEGDLVDDFLIVEGERSVHVCNAPSPAATAAFPIGRSVAERIVEGMHRPAAPEATATAG